MATCKYCGNKTGWFVDSHDACRSQYESARAAVSKGVTEVIHQHSNEALLEFKNVLQSIDKPTLVSFSALCLMALEDWQRAVDDVCYTDQTALELTGEQIAFLLHFLQTVF